MASEQEGSYPTELPVDQRVRLQIGVARSALQQARRVLGPEHDATHDLDAALLMLRVIEDDLPAAGG